VVPQAFTRSTNHHHVPDASMAMRAPRGSSAKNCSSRVDSPHLRGGCRLCPNLVQETLL
jgi:hypothetical protein